MIKYFLNLVYLLTLFIVFQGCSSHPTEAEVVQGSAKKSQAKTVSIESQQVAAEQKADFFTEVNFKPKQIELSAVNKEKINKIIHESLAKGKIQEIKVIAWADSEYPSVHTKKLSSEQRNLAKSRGQTIENYIESHRSEIKVKTYSMAERANVLKEFIGSSEARLKKSLEMAGIPTI